MNLKRKTHPTPFRLFYSPHAPHEENTTLLTYKNNLPTADNDDYTTDNNLYTIDNNLSTTKNDFPAIDNDIPTGFEKQKSRFDQPWSPNEGAKR